jgi:hypothetical protein
VGRIAKLRYKRNPGYSVRPFWREFANKVIFWRRY